MNARLFIPENVSLWLFSVYFFALMTSVTFAALQISETGMVLLQSITAFTATCSESATIRLADQAAHSSAGAFHSGHGRHEPS